MYDICTVILQSVGDDYFTSNRRRLNLLGKILSKIQSTNILLFPGGYFRYGTSSNEVTNWIKSHVIPLVNENSPETVVVFGVDLQDSKGKESEFGYAVSKSSIKSIARKFYGHKSLELASTPWIKEQEHNRYFIKKGKRYYLAVCYDSFGLRHKKVEQHLPIDCVLNMIHYFGPKKEKNHSGDVYFARHGLVGVAKQWGCTVFGATHFLNRDIASKWPSGVRWKRRLQQAHHWKYSDNKIKPILTENLSLNGQNIELRYF